MCSARACNLRVKRVRITYANTPYLCTERSRSKLRGQAQHSISSIKNGSRYQKLSWSWTPNNKATLFLVKRSLYILSKPDQNNVQANWSMVLATRATCTLSRGMLTSAPMSSREGRHTCQCRYYHSQGKNSYFLPLSDQEEFQWVSIESFLSSVRLAKSKDKARTYKLNAADKKVVKKKSSEFFESETGSE